MCVCWVFGKSICNIVFKCNIHIDMYPRTNPHTTPGHPLVSSTPCCHGNRQVRAALSLPSRTGSDTHTHPAMLSGAFYGNVLYYPAVMETYTHTHTHPLCDWSLNTWGWTTNISLNVPQGETVCFRENECVCDKNLIIWFILSAG